MVIVETEDRFRIIVPIDGTSKEVLVSAPNDILGKSVSDLARDFLVDEEFRDDVRNVGSDKAVKAIVIDGQLVGLSFP